MVIRTQCLGAEESKGLVGRPLPAEEADSLAEHLEQCHECAVLVESLLRGDAMENTLRDHGSADSTSVPGASELIARLKGIVAGQPRDLANDATYPPDASGTGTNLLPATASQGGTWDFLAPPQGSGEMGRLGPYRVLEVLGKGGMGVVFRAEDPNLERHVALKAMLPSVAGGASAKERFLREARAAAKVRHDHIVTIHQVGEDRGAPFLAMEFLEGEPLDERLKREGKLAVPEVLRIGRQIALGLAAAHAKGLIHRDIKPANVWLEAPEGRVKILDFGLARGGGEEPHLTQEGAIIGTPAYMAPEQARGEAVDARTDLFSLGCVLYRMAAGQQPFGGKDAISTMMAVALESPRPPGELNPDVPAALSDLTLRLLEKDPARRPDSAKAVADALAAIDAAPAKPPEDGLTAVIPDRPAPGGVRPRRMWPWVAAAALLLAGGGAWLAWTLTRVESDEGTLVVEVDDDAGIEIAVKQGGVVVMDRTNKREFTLKLGKGKEGEIEVFDSDGLRLTTEKFELVKGKVVRVRVTRDAVVAGRKKGGGEVTPPPAGASPFDSLRRADLSAYELKVAGDGDPAKAPKELVAVLGETRRNHPSGAKILAFSPDGKRLASGGLSRIQIWDAATGQLVVTIPDSYVRVLGYGPEGKWLAYSHSGHTPQVKFLDLSSGQATARVKGPPGGAAFIALSPDGSKAASSPTTSQQAGAGEVTVWDTTTGKSLWTIKTDNEVSVAAFSPDGKSLAGGLAKVGVVKVWEAGTGKEIHSLQGPQTKGCGGLAFHPEGKQLAAGFRVSAELHVWDAATGKPIRVIDTKKGDAHRRPLAYTPDGKFLAVGLGNACEVGVWDAATGREAFHLPGVGSTTQSLAISKDGKRLAVANAGGAIQVFDMATRKQVAPASGHAGEVRAAVVSRDGKWIVSGGADDWVRVWDVATGKQAAALPMRSLSGASSVAISADGRRVAGHGAYAVVVWDRVTGKELFKGKGGVNATGLALSPDGSRVAAVSGNMHAVTVFDVATGKAVLALKHSAGIRSVDYSPDGKLLAASVSDGAVQIWDAATGEGLRSIQAEKGIRRVSFSPDSKHLLTGDGFIRDVQSGKEVVRFGKWIGDVAYSADGKAIVDLSLRVWDAATGKPLQEIKQPVNGLTRDVAFAPDGRHVVAANNNGTLAVYRLREAASLASPFDAMRPEDVSADARKAAGGGNPARAPRGLVAVFAVAEKENPINFVAASPDGRRLYAASSKSGDRMLRVYDTTTGKELPKLAQGPGGSSFHAALSLDGRLLAVSGAGKGLMVSVFDAATGAPVVTVGRIAAGTIGHFSFSPDGKRIAVPATVRGEGKQGNGLKVFDTASGHVALDLDDRVRGVHAAAFSADGRRLAVGLIGSVKILDAGTGKELLSLPNRDAYLGVPIYAPAGGRLAIPQQGHVGVYDGTSGKELAKLPGRSRDVAFSRDGKRVATLLGAPGRATEIAVWDVETGKKAITLDMPVGSRAVAFAADGRHLLVGAVDGTVLVLRLEEGR